MADTLLELGLCRTEAELDNALWEMDIRKIQQLNHARLFRSGVKTRWASPLEGGADDIEAKARKIAEREFLWPLELL